MYKVISIEDTRSWDWNIGKPIPGSGCQRPCDHCGKTHDVIVTIDNSGKRMDVGTTCAKKLSAYGMDYDSKSLKSIAVGVKVKEVAQLLFDFNPTLRNWDDRDAIQSFCNEQSTPGFDMHYGRYVSAIMLEYHEMKIRAKKA